MFFPIDQFFRAAGDPAVSVIKAVSVGEAGLEQAGDFITTDRQHWTVALGAESTVNLPWYWGKFATKLPAGAYRFSNHQPTRDEILVWALSQYRFSLKSTETEEPPRQLVVDKTDVEAVRPILEAWFLARELINLPANLLDTQSFAQRIAAFAQYHRLKKRYLSWQPHRTISAGTDSTAEAFMAVLANRQLRRQAPMLSVVGESSINKPLLLALSWPCRRAGGKRLALIGKGVVFDTGGLDLKPSKAMALMKKDMAGAALALAVSHILLEQGILDDAGLTLFLPLAENAVSSSAYRTSDVLTAKTGQTVEVGNTDAEGRLLLADAIILAKEIDPALIVDFATLTGAARVALGTDVPGLFVGNDESLAELLCQASQKTRDPLWRLPLIDSYRKILDSPIADIHSTGQSGYAGAILAALFLRHFVGTQIPWAHLDLMGYNLASRPGRPVGGEAQGLLAMASGISAYLRQRGVAS